MKVCIHTKGNEVLINATVWKNLENILSGEKRHKRPHIVAFCLYEMSRIGKSIETELSVGSRGGERGNEK